MHPHTLITQAGTCWLILSAIVCSFIVTYLQGPGLINAAMLHRGILEFNSWSSLAELACSDLTQVELAFPQNHLSHKIKLYACLHPALQRDRKLAEQRAQLNGSTDPTTGKQLYKPETGRAPRNAERNREGKPIGEYLYQAAQVGQRSRYQCHHCMW